MKNDFDFLSDQEIENIIIAELKKAAGKPTAVGYCRVSTDKEEQEKSKENQVFLAKEFINKQGWYPVIIFPVSESGYKENRRYFNLMISLAYKHKIKYLIFKNDIRKDRNPTDCIALHKYIKRDIFEIYYYTGGSLTSKSKAADFAMEGIKSFFNELQSAQLSENIKAAHEFKALTEKKAVILGIGYLWDREKRQWIFDPAYHGIIKSVHDLYDFGKDKKIYALPDLYQYCKAMGYKTKNDCNFSKSTIYQILTNKSYAGFYKYQDQWYKGEHPAYISENRLNERMLLMGKKRKTRSSSNEKNDLHLMIKCSECKRYYSGYTKKGKPYFFHRCLEDKSRNQTEE